MTTNHWRAAILLLSALCLRVAVAAGGPAAAAVVTEADQVGYLKDAHNSMAQLLYELAAERHEALSSAGKIWVFALYRGREIKKFTDGKLTVVYLPIQLPTDPIAMQLYINQFNSFNILTADSMVESGNYDGAKTLLRLLAKVTRGDPLMEARISKRLETVDLIQDAAQSSAALQQYKGLSFTLGSIVKLWTLDSLDPAYVPDLLSADPKASPR